MGEKSDRKIDRRTLYTKQVVKDAFLLLKRRKDYNTITVADICRAAEISRGTFYLHYKNIAEVLDEVLDDAFMNISDLLEHFAGESNREQARCSYPFCQFIRSDKKYRCIFFDDALTSHIINKLSALYKDRFIQNVIGETQLPPSHAELLFYFQINGCFAIAKRCGSFSTEEWCPAQNVIDQFIRHGLQAFSEHFSVSCSKQDRTRENE